MHQLGRSSVTESQLARVRHGKSHCWQRTDHCCVYVFVSVQVAFIGFAVQALATRTTPLEGLSKHLADPVGRNITYYLTHGAEVLAGTA